MTSLPLVVAITGASGLIYGLRLLSALRATAIETHLVMSRSAKRTLAHEGGPAIDAFEALAARVHHHDDLAAPIASGSFRTRGMIVAPCSAKTLGEIAAGIGGNLVARAADVTLKERRRLVLMVRETPLTLIHCRNMVTVTEAGAIVMPPVPAFYAQPQTIEAMVDQTVGRALDLFDIDAGTVARWSGPPT